MIDMDPIRVVYHGAPKTKKNSQRIVWLGRRPALRPGRDWEAYETAAVAELGATRLEYLRRETPLGSRKHPLHVQAVFYLAARQQPDLDGLITGCADLLEKSGLIANDYHIHSWDGSRRLRDPDNPRVEVTIRTYEGDDR